MFSFRRTPPSTHPSPALQHALTLQGLPATTPANSLRVITTRGTYAGRAVRFFRVFDPQLTHNVRTFHDLDGQPRQVVGSGHFERDGLLTLTARASAADEPTPSRERADRAVHADDERLVFWNAESSRSSAGRLSEAASTWQQARSTRQT